MESTEKTTGVAASEQTANPKQVSTDDRINLWTGHPPADKCEPCIAALLAANPGIERAVTRVIKEEMARQLMAKIEALQDARDDDEHQEPKLVAMAHSIGKTDSYRRHE
jgi:hypothetical protein